MRAGLWLLTDLMSAAAEPMHGDCAHICQMRFSAGLLQVISLTVSLCLLSMLTCRGVVVPSPQPEAQACRWPWPGH